MARRLSLSASSWIAVPLAASLCGLPAAGAQTLRDPTRPPIAAAKGRPATAAPAAWVLQSVLISPERRYAVINGQLVSLGESVAGAQLVAVAENRVTLRTQEGIRIVQLFPDVTRRGTEQGAKGAAKEHAETPPAQRHPKDKEEETPGAQ